ncbi:unnamed protein product, partial [Rotaria magnacalcarata]
NGILYRMKTVSDPKQVSKRIRDGNSCNALGVQWGNGEALDPIQPEIDRILARITRISC